MLKTSGFVARMDILCGELETFFNWRFVCH